MENTHNKTLTQLGTKINPTRVDQTKIKQTVPSGG